GAPPMLEYASHALDRPWNDGPSELRRARGVVPVPTTPTTGGAGCGVPAALPTPGMTSVAAAGLLAGAVDGEIAIRGIVLRRGGRSSATGALACCGMITVRSFGLLVSFFTGSGTGTRLSPLISLRLTTN